MHSSDGDKTIDGVDPRPLADVPPVGKPSIAPPSTDYPELTQVDRHHYVIDGEIAKGGMGRVLAARDLRLGRQVAIKELLPKNRDAAKRFEREARITARLQHPAIIHVYEAGIWPGGEPFYAMPRVSGRSLDKVVAERVTVAERLPLLPNVIAVADALAYAHSQNVIHRDLKPANVLVGEFGETVVIDWGLAKDLGAQTDPRESLAMRIRVAAEETVSGSIVGTPAYMPPEQARGESVDQRIDVYAIGALLYKVLAGRAPYEGKHGKDIIEQVKAGPPPRIAELAPGAPRELVAIVEKAMARNPDDRYITAGELAQDLKRFQTGQLVAAHRYTRLQLITRFVRRHRVALAVATVSVAALVVVGTISVRKILAETRVAENRGAELLKARGIEALLGDHAGMALPYFVEALRLAGRDEPLSFLVADAIRSYEAQVAQLPLTGSTRIAASSDGLHLATAAQGRVELWSVDGVRDRVLGNARDVRVLAFDPGGKLVAAGGDDGAVEVWHTDGKPSFENHRHTGAIEDLAFSPQGDRLVTAGEDAHARLWDAASGELLADIKCHDGPVLSVRFSPDGNRIATASRDASVCITDGHLGTLVRKVQVHEKAVVSVRWSADGLLLVTASDDGTAQVLSAARGTPVVSPMHSDLDAPMYAAEITSDNRLLTAGADNVARVWQLPAFDDADLTDPEPQKSRPAAPPTKLPPLKLTLRGHDDKIVIAAWSLDETRIVTAGLDRRAVVWDPENGERVAMFEHSDPVADAAFLVGNKRLVTTARGGAPRIWDIDRATPRRWNVGIESEIHAIASSGSVLAVGTDDSRVTLWRGTDAKVLPDGHESSVLALAFTPDGQRLVTGSAKNHDVKHALFVWDVARGVKIRELGSVTESVRAIAAAPDGDTIAAIVGGNVMLWSLSTGEQRTLGGAGATFDAIAFSPTGLLAAGGAERTLVVWYPTFSDQPIATADLPGAITALSFSRDGQALAVAEQGDARIYPVHGAVLGAPVSVEGATGEVRAVTFSRTGGLLITASDQGVAKVWDAKTGRLLGTRDPHGKPLTALALAGDGNALWLAASNGELGLWDIHRDERWLLGLTKFVDERVAWVLNSHDVVERKELHGQR